MYKCIHTCIYIHIYMSAHIHTYTYTHTHIKCTYATHASTPGTTVQQRTCKEPLQTKEALHFSQAFIQRNQTSSHLQCKDFIVPTSCTLIPLHPPSPLPNIPQNSLKLAQLHNGPLRSCRKIEGKTAVQQSRSKRARRNPSLRMIKVTVHEETRGQRKKRPNPATAHTQ